MFKELIELSKVREAKTAEKKIEERESIRNQEEDRKKNGRNNRKFTAAVTDVFSKQKLLERSACFSDVIVH